MTAGQVPVDVGCMGWPSALAYWEEAMSTTVRDRIGAVTGGAFVALILVGNQMASVGSAQSAHPTGEQVLRDAARQVSSTSVAVGVALEVLGFAAFLGFLGYLADVLHRAAGGRRGSIAAGAGIVAGAVMVAVKLGSAAPIMTLWVDHGHISPQLALVLNDLGGVAFVISWLPFAIFVGAAAAALHRAGLIGRPTAFSGLILGAAGLVLSIIGIQDPIGASPLAFLLGLLWLLVVSVRLAVRPGNGASAGMTSGTADARVAVGA
jgi:hypothetical protein